MNTTNITGNTGMEKKHMNKPFNHITIECLQETINGKKAECYRMLVPEDEKLIDVYFLKDVTSPEAWHMQRKMMLHYLIDLALDSEKRARYYKEVEEAVYEDH